MRERQFGNHLTNLDKHICLTTSLALSPLRGLRFCISNFGMLIVLFKDCED